MWRSGFCWEMRHVKKTDERTSWISVEGLADPASFRKRTLVAAFERFELIALDVARLEGWRKAGYCHWRRCQKSSGVEGLVVPHLRCWNKRAGRILSTGTDSSSCCISGHFRGFRSPSHQIYSSRARKLVPGEKPEKRIKTQNIRKDDSIPLCSPVCQSTGSRWEQKEDVGRCWWNQRGFGPKWKDFFSLW